MVSWQRWVYKNGYRFTIEPSIQLKVEICIGVNQKKIPFMALFGIEAADKNSRELKAEPTATAELNLILLEVVKNDNPDPDVVETQVCRFKKAVCHKCKKTGHIAPVCTSGSQY